MSGSSKPGPLCAENNPMVIDPGTLNCHRSPSPGPVCLSRGRRFAKVQIGTLVFSEERLKAFLDSVAHAKVTERYTKTVWKNYNENTVLNLIYSILPERIYGRPGNVEVETGDVQPVLRETRVESQRLLEAFLTAVSRGPEKAVGFMKAQQEIRQVCTETVQSVFRDASSLNDEIQNAVRKGIARLTVIKAASTITLKAAGLSVGALPAFLISTGYDATLKLVGDWEGASGATLVGIEIAKGTGQTVTEHAADRMKEIFEAEKHDPTHKAEWLRKRLTNMEKELEHEGNARMLRKFAKDNRRLARAEQETARATRGARVASSVKFIFFAWDIYEAGEDANKTFEQAGYERSWAGIKDAFAR